jgi:hypothetical protein
VDDFYEYASTVYGGPASFFYTLVDVYASFEYLRHSTAMGAERDGLRGIAERYDMSVGEAAEWYDSYRAEQELRYQKFLAQRDYTVDTLRSSGFEVLRPRYSVNCTVGPIDHHSSYGFFRRALDEVGVSVYPSILAFDLSDTTVRVTAGRDSNELRTALDRLTRLDAGSRR